jgi:pimeloyl-ACP methyl ester carboxylesterase
MADRIARGVRFHCQRLGPGGDGRRVVFVHGLVMDNLSSWYFTLATPVAAFSEVFLYDLRGHGLSERPSTGYTLRDMVADLMALLDQEPGPRDVHLVGNSFGALLALKLALDHPERARSLTLVDGHLGDQAFGPQMAATLLLEGEERDQAIADSFKDWLGRHSERKRNRLAANARSLILQTSLVADLQATPPLSEGDFAHLQLPILGIYGERSNLRPMAERLLPCAPHATLRILPGSSHSVLWEASDRVREEVIAFLQKNA